MSNQQIPQPPCTARGHHVYKQTGDRVCYIWVLDAEGWRVIDNQYATAKTIMKLKKCSQATAYRIIASLPKRYWLIDMSKRPHSCISVLPVQMLKRIEILPIGNPSWRNGLYQQQNRHKALDKITK